MPNSRRLTIGRQSSKVMIYQVRQKKYKDALIFSTFFSFFPEDCSVRQIRRLNTFASIVFPFMRRVARFFYLKRILSLSSKWSGYAGSKFLRHQADFYYFDSHFRRVNL